MKPLQAYNYQPFPNLSAARLPTADRHHFFLPFDCNHDIGTEQLRLFARLAFAHVVLQYVESRDFLFGEVVIDDPADYHSWELSQLKPVRLQIDAPVKDHPDGLGEEGVSVTWDDLAIQLKFALRNYETITIEQTKKLLGLSDQSELFPFPAVFLWDWNSDDNISQESKGVYTVASVPSRYASLAHEATLIMGISHPPDGLEDSLVSRSRSPLLHASSSGTLMSSAMISTFLHQVRLVFTRICSDPTAVYKSSLPYTPTDASHHLSSPTPSGSEPSAPALFSEYTSPKYAIQLESAISPLKWLSMISNSHPTRVAHEVYGPHAFASPPSPTPPAASESQGCDNFDIDSRPLEPTSTLNYGRLNFCSNVLARWLLRPFVDYSQTGSERVRVTSILNTFDGQGGGGIGKGDKICVCLERTASFYIVQAAIWRAGGVYVPIDPSLPLERKKYLVQDSGASLVFLSLGEELAGGLDFRLTHGNRVMWRSEKPNTTLENTAYDFGSRHIRTVILSDDIELDRVLDNSVEPQNRNPALSELIDEEDKEAGDIEEAGLDDVAYLIYTSGTTGKPKGCLLTHRGVYHAVSAMCEYVRSGINPERDKRLAMASIAFDVHISEIVFSWALGIRLVSTPLARFELLADMYNNVRRLGITHLGMVPSMIEGTFTGGAEQGSQIGIKYLASGGEKISDSLLNKWADHPKLILANFYGPTEATIGCTSRQVRANDRKENIGTPFSACRAFVVRPREDAHFEVVPRGTPGELIIEGPLVGLGYHNNSKATRKNFIEWPHPGCRAYRTGDLVRMMPDDTLEIIGRIDSQVKLRGVRIETEGISNVLTEAAKGKLQRSIVSMTVVGGHDTVGGGSELLLSFIAPGGDMQPPVSSRKSGRRPTIVLPSTSDGFFSAELMQTVKEAANKELPSYMRPAYILPISFIPLNANGKADGKVLKELFRASQFQDIVRTQRWNGDDSEWSHDSGSIVATVDREPTPSEILVIELISRLTRSANLSFRSNLFELGLDSIKFSVLARLVRQELLPDSPGSRPIGVSELMSRPTIQDVALLVEDHRNGLTNSPKGVRSPSDRTYTAVFDDTWRAEASKVFEPSEIEAVLPPFPVQEGVIFQSVQEPGHYVEHFLYQCEAGIDLEKLRNAWERVVARQYILRTIFVLDIILLQVVLKPGVSPLPWQVNHAAESESDSPGTWFNPERFQSIAEDITADITTPMFRIQVYQTGVRTYMAFSVNHAIYDGISIGLLMDEVTALYCGLPGKVEPVNLATILNEIPPKDDLLVRSFWTSRLGHIRLDDRPRRRPSRRQRPTRIQRPINVSFSDLAQRCSALHITVQALSIVAYGIVIRNVFSPDIDSSVFGVIRSGRSLPIDDVEYAICPLVCVVPTVVDLKDVSIQQLLSAAQTDIAETSAFEHTSIGGIQRWLGTRDLIDSLFSCRVESPRAPNDILRYLSTESSRAEFVLAVELFADPSSDNVELRAAFSEPELDLRTVESLLEGLESTIHSLARGSGQLSSLLEPKHHEDFQTSTLLSEPTKSTSDEYYNQGLEDKITCLVSEFLKVEQSVITPTASLISFGLDSLRAVSLSRLLHMEEIFVSPIDIVQADSIRTVAAKANSPHAHAEVPPDVELDLVKLQNALVEELPPNDVRIDAQDNVLICGATALQSGMLSQTLSSGGSLYVHAFTFRLRRGNDMEAVRNAWTKAVQRFDILRTSFHFAHKIGRWAQAVHTSEDLKWTSLSKDDVTHLETDFVALHSFKEERDFARSPLFFYHVSAPAGEYLVIVMHHALYDGVSLPKLLREVHGIYRNDPQSPHFQFHQIITPILTQEIAGVRHWSSRLAGFMPWRFPRKAGLSGPAWRASVVVNLENAAVERACRRYQVSPQCIGQAAWAKVLATTSGMSDVVFGHVVSGRALPGASEIIAPVFNTIPCRVVIHQGETNKELLRSVQKWNVDSLPWHHASLRLVLQDLRVPYLCDTLFLFQPRQENAPELDRIWDIMGRVDGEQTKTQYSINVEFHQNQTDFSIHASCASEIMDRSTLERLIHKMSDAIIQIITLPNALALPERLYFPPELTLQSSIPETVDNPHEMPESWSQDQQKLRDIIVHFTSLPEKFVRRHTDLASLGIDSISAIQISALCKQAGLTLSTADVASSTAMNDLMARLDRHQEHDTRDINSRVQESYHFIPDLEAIQRKFYPGLSQSIDFISPTLAGMEWLIGGWQSARGYQFQHAFVLSSAQPLNSPQLKIAWKALTDHHFILRSTFCSPGINESSSAPLLVTFKNYEPDWNEFVLEDSDSDKELDSVARYASALVRSPPSPQRPPSRLTLLRGRTMCYMILNLHHVQYDAWSLRLLAQDLELLYLGQKPRASNAYREFLHNVMADPNRLDIQRTYWESIFHGFGKPTLFPLLNNSPPGKANQSHRLNCIFREVLRDLDELERRSKALGLPLHIILLACWADVQRSWSHRSSRKTNNPTNEDEVIFGLWHAGRSMDSPSADLEMNNLAIPTINILPVRVSFSSLDESNGARGLVATAKRLRVDLQRRTPLIEQTRWTDVGNWIQGASTDEERAKPICNVFVNVLKVPTPGALDDNDLNSKETESSVRTTRLFKFIKLPYRIPPPAEVNLTYSFEPCAITNLVQPDLLIEIFFTPSTKSAGLAIECNPQMLSEDQARSMMEAWVTVVRQTLEMDIESSV